MLDDGRRVPRLLLLAGSSVSSPRRDGLARDAAPRGALARRGGHPPRIALARRAAPLETALGPRRHGLARRAVNFALAHGARARRRSPRSDLRARGAARYWVLLSQNSDSQNSDSFPRAL